VIGRARGRARRRSALRRGSLFRRRPYRLLLCSRPHPAQYRRVLGPWA